MTELEIIWQQCLMLIKDQDIVSESEFNTWLKTLQPQVKDGVLEIVASNRLIYDFVTKKYWHKITPVLLELTGDVPVKLVVSATRPTLNLKQNTAPVSEQPLSTKITEESVEHKTEANNTPAKPKQVVISILVIGGMISFVVYGIITNII